MSSMYTCIEGETKLVLGVVHSLLVVWETVAGEAFGLALEGKDAAFNGKECNGISSGDARRIAIAPLMPLDTRVLGMVAAPLFEISAKMHVRVHELRVRYILLE